MFWTLLMPAFLSASAAPTLAADVARAFALNARARAERCLESPPRPLSELLGRDPNPFVSPNPNHHPGRAHAAIFRHQVEGCSRLLKIIVPGNPNAPEEEMYRATYGPLLAARLGGPRIFRAGRLARNNGEVAHFLDMEELFAQDDHTFTLKGVLDSNSHAPIESAPPLYSTQATRLALHLRRMMERSIQPTDIDLIFAPSDLRFIDATLWQSAIDFGPPPAPLEDGRRPVLYLAEYIRLMQRLTRLDSTFARGVVTALVAEIGRSSLWDEDERRSLLGVLKRELIRLNCPADFNDNDRHR